MSDPVTTAGSSVVDRMSTRIKAIPAERWKPSEDPRCAWLATKPGHIHVFVPGEPIGKGRARFGNGRAYTPAKTRKWEDLAATCARIAHGAKPPFGGPTAITVVATFSIPKSWSKAKRAATRSHISKPDGSNVLKAVEDALNDVIWVDDSQIVRATVEKRYGDVPGVSVTVESLA